MCNNADRAEQLRCKYQSLRNEYSGMCISDDHTFDRELVSHVIGGLKRGKAAGFDGLTAEHLLFCHPAVCVDSNTAILCQFPNPRSHLVSL